MRKEKEKAKMLKSVLWLFSSSWQKKLWLENENEKYKCQNLGSYKKLINVRKYGDIFKIS